VVYVASLDSSKIFNIIIIITTVECVSVLQLLDICPNEGVIYRRGLFLLGLILCLFEIFFFCSVFAVIDLRILSSCCNLCEKNNTHENRLLFPPSLCLLQGKVMNVENLEKSIHMNWFS